MRRIFSTLLSTTPLIFTPLVFADDIRFTILERGTGNPIAEATVALGNGEFGETNSEGQLELATDDLPQGVRIFAQGYETLQSELTPAGSPVYYLTPRPHEMAALEVVEDRIPEKASKITLTADELKRTPGTGGDPINAVQSLPGVVSAGEGSGQMYMRGSDTHENGALVNGIPIGYLYHFGGLRSTINPALVEDFNVFLGGFPVEYGDRLGGVIDVQLREPKTDRLHHSWHIGTYESSFLIEGPLGQSGRDSFFIGGRRSYIDVLLSADAMTELMGDDSEDAIIQVPRYYDTQAGWHRKLDNGTFDLLWSSADDEMKFFVDSIADTEPELAGNFEMDTGYKTLGANWQSSLNSKWQQQTVISASRYHEDVLIGTDDEGNPYYSDSKIDSLRIQPELYFTPNAHNRLTLGTEIDYQYFPLKLYVPEPQAPGEVDYDFTTAPKHKVHRDLDAINAAPFAKYSHTFDDLTLSIGGRYSIMRASDDIAMEAFSPRLGIEYQLADAVLLTANWGHYVQSPEPIYLLKDFGNPRLGYTKAEHRVIGAQVELNPHWSLQLEGYHKPMSQLVVGSGEEAPDNYVNEGTGEAYGADLLIKHEGANGAMGWLSYAYAQSTRTNELTGEKDDFDSDQPHSLNLVWSQPFPGNWNQWTWGVRVQAHSGTPYTPIIGRAEETLEDGSTRYVPIYGEYNSERLPTYFRTDLRLDRTFLFRQWNMNMYFDLQNLSFSKNVVDYDYGDNYEYYDNPREIRGMPFFPHFGVELNF